MIETSNPEIDVNQLMERVRQEAAKIRSHDTSGGELRAHPRRSALPTIPEMPAPPVLGFSRPLDAKVNRVEVRLEKARKMIEVGRGIPKMFHRFFRRQGGFNRAALETLNELTKTNVRLNKRVGEITVAAEQQNQWLRVLARQRQTEAGWMKAAGALVAQVPSAGEAIAELREKLVALEIFMGGATNRIDHAHSQLEQLGEKLRAIQDECARSSEDLQVGLNGLRDASARMGEHLRNLQAQTDQQSELGPSYLEQLGRHGVHLRNLQLHLDQEAEGLKGARQDLDGHGQHLRNLQGEVALQENKLLHFKNLEDALNRLDERQVNDSIFIKGELSRHSLLLHQTSVGKVNEMEEGVRLVSGGAGKTDSHRLDAFYLSFENRFRGTRSEIRERIRFYLPFLSDANAGKTGRPILDLGCGRGEWLELLRENGHEAQGVDLNTEMVAQCQERGFKVTLGDAVEYLRALPENSQGAVTGFHIIEHLPLETLIDLVAETRRVLQTGGVAIFESPNCKNLVVGACNFNLDPTHRNPVFPETAAFILETQGFEEIELQYLSPVETSNLSEMPNESFHLKKLLYGPQDFSVIGRKPGG